MSKAATPLRFTHLYAENWRNFTRVDVDFERRTMIAGPSGAGKTNLLDLFRFLHDICAGGGFQAAVRRRGGVSRLRCLAARQHSEIVVSVRVGDGASEWDWEYELRFNQENLKEPAIVGERVTRAGEDLLSRPDEADEADPERLTQTALEQVNSNRPFRELAEFFGAIRYSNPEPQLIREPGRSAGRHDDPYGGDLLERIAASPENVREARLRRIRNALGDMAPQMLSLELWRDSRGAPHLRSRYGHWRPSGAWQTEEQFSDGVLRLIALLWDALDGSAPLLLEEPEISFHPEVVRELASLLASAGKRTHRQMLITTHAKDIFAGEAMAAAEVILLMPGESTVKVRAAASLQDAPALLDGTLRADLDAPSLLDENQLDLFEGAAASE